MAVLLLALVLATLVAAAVLDREVAVGRHRQHQTRQIGLVLHGPHQGLGGFGRAVDVAPDSDQLLGEVADPARGSRDGYQVHHGVFKLAGFPGQFESPEGEVHGPSAGPFGLPGHVGPAQSVKIKRHRRHRK